MVYWVNDCFDRRILPDNSGVLRRHVIDGCQATNLPPSYKYERQFGDEGDGIYIRDGVSFPKLFNVETTNSEAYQTQLVRWLTFNMLVRNYDAHGKNISFFVDKTGLALTPFYDLVNIEAIIREVQSSSVDGTRAQENIIPQHYAMSIGEYDTGNAGNFNSPISAYMLADFADEFEISLPRMQLLMSQMVKSVFGAIAIAKRKALEQGLSAEEVNHIDLCIEIVNEAAEEVNKAIEGLPAMKELFQ